MPDLQSDDIQCPYCGQQIEVIIDCSIGRQQYIEDCSVCCRPILLLIMTAEQQILSVEARTEDE